MSLDLVSLGENFERDGYVVLNGFFDEQTCNKVIEEAEAYLISQNVEPIKLQRCMNMHQKSDTMRQMFHNEEIMDLLDKLMKADHHFLQTIYFARGSEQIMHSDYVYMSTIPPMQLSGMWVALEDTTENNGPLGYIPGSHKIPIKDIEQRYKDEMPKLKRKIEENKDHYETLYGDRIKMSGESIEQCAFFDEWLEGIHKTAADMGLTTKKFFAKKGDVLLWHANILHGGMPILDKEKTRKSAVGHFLTKQTEKYFDMNYVNHKQHMTLDSIDVNREPEIQSL